MKSLLFSQSVLGLTPSAAAEESAVVLNLVTSFWGCGKECVLPGNYPPPALLPGFWCWCIALDPISAISLNFWEGVTCCKEESAAAPMMVKFCVLLASLCSIVCFEGKFQDHSQRKCWFLWCLMPVEISGLQFIHVQRSWRRMLQQSEVGWIVGSFGRNRAVLCLSPVFGV